MRVECGGEIPVFGTSKLKFKSILQGNALPYFMNKVSTFFGGLRFNGLRFGRRLEASFDEGRQRGAAEHALRQKGQVNEVLAQAC
jgi:hypothetical protein